MRRLVSLLGAGGELECQVVQAPGAYSEGQGLRLSAAASDTTRQPVYSGEHSMAEVKNLPYIV